MSKTTMLMDARRVGCFLISMLSALCGIKEGRGDIVFLCGKPSIDVSVSSKKRVFRKPQTLFVHGKGRVPYFQSGSHLQKTSQIGVSQPLISADKVAFDQSKNTLEAFGNVVVYVENRWLRTHHFCFVQKERLLKLNMPLYLYDPNYAYIIGERASLASDLKNGWIEKVYIYIDHHKEKATFSGRKIKRITDRYSVIENATYSPCAICRHKKPFWQLKSQKVVWDAEKKNMTHHHTRLEIKGVPVFYTPYLSHPDPSVKRRSGLLSPSVLMSNHDTGTMISLPYFWAPKDQYDITLTPSVGIKSNLLKVGYRQKFQKGYTNLTSSIAQHSSPVDKERDGMRWHITGHGVYELNHQWRTRFLANYASDPVYGKRFSQVGFDPAVAHSIWDIERFGHKNYLNVSCINFQETKSTDNPKKLPLILPYVQYHWWDYLPWDNKMLFHYNADFLTIKRRLGTDMLRMAHQGELSRQWISKIGWVMAGTSSMRMDAYLYEKHISSSQLQGRAFPQTSLDIRYPLIRKIRHGSIIVSPIGKMIFAPYKNQKTPHIDTFIVDIDDSNILAETRFLGKDKLDDGTRFVYGLHVEGASNHKKIDLFLGKSHKKRNNNLYGECEALRLHLVYPDFARLYLRSSFRKNVLQSAEINLIVGPAYRYVALSYVKRPQQIQQEESLEQLQIDCLTRLSERWFVSGKLILHPKAKQKMLAQSAGLYYENECFNGLLSLEKSFFKDRDLRPGTTFFLRLAFKNLGNVRYKHSLEAKLPQEAIRDII